MQTATIIHQKLLMILILSAKISWNNFNNEKRGKGIFDLRLKWEVYWGKTQWMLISNSRQCRTWGGWKGSWRSHFVTKVSQIHGLNLRIYASEMKIKWDPSNEGHVVLLEIRDQIWWIRLESLLITIHRWKWAFCNFSLWSCTNTINH